MSKMSDQNIELPEKNSYFLDILGYYFLKTFW